MKAETDNNVPDTVFLKSQFRRRTESDRVDEHENVVAMKGTVLTRRSEFSEQSGTLRVGHKTIEQHDREHAAQGKTGGEGGGLRRKPTLEGTLVTIEWHRDPKRTRPSLESQRGARAS